MQSPTRVVCRDRYDIESLTQKKPNGFKPTLLNAATASVVKSIARLSSAPERKLLQLLGLFCRRQLAFELEQGVLHSQQQFFALVLFFIAGALYLKSQRLNFFSQVFNARLHLLNVIPVLLRFAGEKEKLADVFKELPQHD